MGVMKEAKAVMIWRQVEDLGGATRALRSHGVEWRKIGEDSYSAIFDAGAILTGFWVQNQQLIQDQCSDLTFDLTELVVNPASELLIDVKPEQFDERLSSLARRFRPSLVRPGLAPLAPSARAGPGAVASQVAQPAPSSASDRARERKVSFYDDSGNLFAFAAAGRPPSGAAGSHQHRLSALVRNRGDSAPIVANRRMVSDLGRSTEFYRRVLEFEPLGECEFRSGLLQISLVEEPQFGLVASLRRRNRFNAEWLVLHVGDIRKAVKELQGKGVEFPKGIETSDSGTAAVFNDPDGHTIVVWTPPSPRLKPKIDVRPQVRNILAIAD